jgi:crotonobetainyl-CoA:carnitine CoA-transferase CaiB-like acyl-CoA transferase
VTVEEPSRPHSPTRPFASAESLPLTGVKVVDLSRFLAGPYSATLLGDLGADVIKVEALDRDDPAAHTAPMIGTDSVYYLATVRNKRSIGLDLKSAEGYALLARLCEDADVVVENYRADVPAKLDLEYEDFKRMNPRVVLCSIRSFPRESSIADAPAYDSAVQAYTGLMSVTGTEEGGVARMGVAVADLGAGLFSAVGTLAAVIDARARGVGRHVEVALSDTGIALMALQLSTYMNTDTVIARSGTEHPAMAPLRVFSTTTGDILVMAAKDEEFTRMCQAIGLTDALSDRRFATNALRVQNRTALHALMERILHTGSAEEWLAKLGDARVACTPVRHVDDIAKDDDFERTMLVEHEHPRLGTVKLVRNPITLDGASPPFRTLAPSWAQDSAEILAGLGLNQQDIESLRQRRIIA